MGVSRHPAPDHVEDDVATRVPSNHVRELQEVGGAAVWGHRYMGDERYHLLIAEFGHMRDEINSRSRIQVNLVLAALTALGAGVSVVETFQDALLAVAAIISILSFLWTDHDKQINTLGAYIALYLEPALAEVTGTFQWEGFFRGMDQGGETASRTLYLNSAASGDPPMPIPPDRGIVSEYALLFFWVPTVLLVAYGFVIVFEANDIHGSHTGARVLGLVATAVTLAVSYRRQQFRMRRRRAIERRLADRDRPTG